MFASAVWGVDALQSVSLKFQLEAPISAQACLLGAAEVWRIQELAPRSTGLDMSHELEKSFTLRPVSRRKSIL